MNSHVTYMRWLLLAITLIAINTSTATSQDIVHTTKIISQPNEKWWGGFVGYGHNMPFESSTRLFDLSRENFNNQIVPLLVSNEGRYIWTEDPFRFKFSADTLIILSKYESDIKAISAGKTLREAYLAASKKHFAPTSKIPHEEFFSKPQYNTWIELMYDQNQHDILDYANKALKNGFPSGIFMIDDNWQKYYGNFDFKPEKFPDPKTMIDSLHNMGFDVMLWVCPYVTPDSPEYRYLSRKGYLIKNERGGDAIFNWWNGYSACYDMTNPDAVNHLKGELEKLQKKYGVDGF